MPIDANTLRRDFLKLPLAGGAAAALGPAAVRSPAAARIAEDDPNNTKIATEINAHSVSDDYLLMLRQIGLRWLHVEFGDEGSYEFIKSTQERVARYGLKIHVGTLGGVYHSLRIQLGQPGRDADIEKFQTFLRDLGRLGISRSKIDFHPGNTYTTNVVESARGYRVREFSVDDFRRKVEKQRFEQQYSADEMWAHYTYFIKAALPVAEKADVRLALHPDDPPLAMMNGVAKLFVNYEGLKRAEQVAGGSSHFGLMFCVGTWLEGGQTTGKDVFGIIEDFGARGRIFGVHFRNVSSPLPRFHETFADDGYMDMYRVMKAFRRVRCTASLIPDHYPRVAGDAQRRAAEAYSIAYMRALLRRANEEVG